MGVVVAAIETATQQRVAVKLVVARAGSEDASRVRFLREAEALLRLKHPAIVGVKAVFPEQRALVMDYVRGETLRALLEREGRLSANEVRKLGLPLLDALLTAHRAEVVHRDVKPSNIILRGPGDPVLVDFGIVALQDAVITQPGGSIGTPSYMPAEQLRGQRVDARADLYALGATLYEAATGERLHSAAPGREGPLETVTRATGDRRLARALHRALQERPYERFASAQDFAAALQTLAPPRHRLRRFGWALALALAACFAFLAGARAWRDGVFAGPPAQLGQLAMPTPSTPSAMSPSGVSGPLEGRLGAAENALSSHHFRDAEQILTDALRAEPSSPHALYLYAVVGWWLELPEKDVKARIDRTETANLRAEQRAFLDGLGDLVAGDHLRAASRFEALVARYPHDRDVLYGLFEARYHAGNPALAWTAFQSLVQSYPEFRLGLLHIFDYGASRGDKAILDFVLARPGVRTESIYAPWLGRYYIALKQYDTASYLLARYDSVPDPSIDRNVLMHDRIEALAFSGRPKQAIDLANQAFGATPEVYPLLFASLYRATQRPKEEAPYLAVAEKQLASSHVASVRATLRLAMLTYELPTRPPQAIRARARALAKDVSSQTALGASGEAMAAVAAGLGGSWTDLRHLAKSPYPEAGALARAFAAEHDGSLSTALSELETAIATSPDGRLVPIERYLLASWARHGNFTEKLEQACKELISPTQVAWSWGSTVRPCWTWLAEAAEARGDQDAARRAREALDALTSEP